MTVSQDPPPHAVAAAVRETHIGVVFMVGDRAYKMKKPVRTDFLDFSTAPLRRAACHREVELNRRLAPDVYLGVGHVVGVDGSDSALRAVRWGAAELSPAPVRARRDLRLCRNDVGPVMLVVSGRARSHRP